MVNIMHIESNRDSSPHRSGKPILSLLICSRNDSYQGNSVWRLQTALNCTAQNVHDLGREEEVELVVIDWGSDTPLRNVLRLTPAAARIVSFMFIPREVADKVRGDSPFPEVLALNAGVRRANGEYIGRIDQDTILGTHFLKTFFEMYEKPRLLVPLESALLLANRRRIPYRFAVRCPSAWVVDRFIRYFGCLLPLMNPLPPHLFYQSFVGIWLLHRNLWYECGGYDERFIYMDWQEVDMILRLTPKYMLINLGELTDHDLYHMDHAHPLGAWEAGRNRKSNPTRDFDNRPEEFFPNGEDWGLIRYPLELLPALSHPETEKVAASGQSRAKWLAFTLVTLVSGSQIALDTMLLYSLMPARRRLFFLYTVWKRRARIAWETIAGEPLVTWPRLLMNRWSRRPSK
jgi:hypothetical protein